MYTQEELQKAAERLAAAGTPYLGKTLYEGEGHKIIVRPYFHGTVDKGLFYLLNEDERPYSDKFIISNMETGESEDLKGYIEKVLPCEIERWEGARKEAEIEEQAARERAEYECFHGFTDGMSHMQKGRVVKVLSVKFRYKANALCDAGIMTRAEWIEKMQESGKARVGIDTYSGKKEYNVYFHEKGWKGELSIEITKTEYEYFQFLESVTIPF
jgi:hypothetical protein